MFIVSNTGIILEENHVYGRLSKVTVNRFRDNNQNFCAATEKDCLPVLGLVLGTKVSGRQALIGVYVSERKSLLWAKQNKRTWQIIKEAIWIWKTKAPVKRDRGSYELSHLYNDVIRDKYWRSRRVSSDERHYR